MVGKAILLVAAVLSCATAQAAKASNVIFVLTDDQDALLGSMDADGPCQSVRARIGGKGTTFSHAFVNTPICCPSRAELTTGRYMHNTKAFDNGCGGQAFVDGPERQNVAWTLKQHSPSHRTFYAGKYLNNYGSPNIHAANDTSASGLMRVPPGWDEWYGLQGNSKYYGYSVSNNGKAEKHGNDYAKDYFTDRVANRSMEFLTGALHDHVPFFMMIAPPASHGPNTPAPQYEQTYAGRRAPRPASYNVTGQQDKHYLLRKILPMDADHAAVADVYFQRRWSVLRSVDDMVVRLLDAIEAAGVADNTFVIYSADNGYHLGEFGMIYDKRMLYETDVRVPLMVRGPGIGANATVHHAATHIDLAPTILEMCTGLQEKPAQMDGRSWLSLARGDTAAAAAWRTEFMVEYSGGNDLPNSPAGSGDEASLATLAVDARTGAELQAEATAFANSLRLATASAADPFCNASVGDELSITGKCSCTVGRISGARKDQSPCDGKNNTYSCVRTVEVASPGSGIVAAGADVTGRTASFKKNTMYCEFNDPEHFVEYYDLNDDPWSLRNLAPTTSAADLAALHERLLQHQACAGDGCFDPSHSPVPVPTPMPVPTGAVQYEQHGFCLSHAKKAPLAAAKCDGPLSLGPCGSASAGTALLDTWWLERKNKTTGGGTIAALLDSSQCINAGMATTADKCQAGACVHMHDCPGQGGGPADLFHFDASSSTLVQETCAPKELCIVAAADGTLALGACGSAAARWNRTVHS